MSDDARKLLELQLEQWRRQCRNSFISFCIEALSARDEVPALHHRLICSELEALARGKCKRLMILAPPGSAKTTYTSRLFPAWYFAFRPRSSIIAVSHTQELSETNSGFVQRIIRDNGDTLGYTLANDAKGRWYTSNSCGYLAGSVGSAILGFRANVAVIDDPIKSRQEAESETSREHTWTWFTNDLLTRLTPDGAIILIATPFHEDDLMGRLQRLQGEEWRVLRLPAVAEGDDDPLGRKEGEPLWADDQYGYGQRLLEIQAAAEREGRSRDWYAQYQGRPRPPEGAMFKPAKMPIIEPAMMPKIVEQVRAWDLASSAKGDWTVGLKLARAYTSAYENTFIVTDIVRFRGPPEEVRSTVKAVAQADGYAQRSGSRGTQRRQAPTRPTATSGCCPDIASKPSACRATRRPVPMLPPLRQTSAVSACCGHRGMASSSKSWRPSPEASTTIRLMRSAWRSASSSRPL
jgi:hypothetical protein